MAIKLVYQAKKQTEEGVEPEMHLYGSLTNVPNAEDEQCVYDVAFDKDNQHFFYTKSAVGGIRIMGVNDSRRQIPTAEDDEMKVTCSGFDVLNGTEESSEKKKISIGECPEHVIATLDKEEVDAGEEVTLTIEFEEGYTPVEGSVKATAGNQVIELTEVEPYVYEGKFTVEDNVEVTVEAEVGGDTIPVFYKVNGQDVAISTDPVEVENIVIYGDGSEVEVGGVIDFEFKAQEGFAITSAEATADAGEMVLTKKDDKYVGTCTLPAANLTEVNIAITVVTEAI